MEFSAFEAPNDALSDVFTISSSSSRDNNALFFCLIRTYPLLPCASIKLSATKALSPKFSYLDEWYL